jgi:hypothetical protein
LRLFIFNHTTNEAWRPGHSFNGPFVALPTAPRAVKSAGLCAEFNATGTSISTGSDIVRLWSIADIAARLESERKPNGLELRWHIGTLQSSPQANSPWSDVTSATSPWMVPTDQSSTFFRVKVGALEVER